MLSHLKIEKYFIFFLLSILGILTPTWRTVLFHPFSNTHKQCADKCQRKVKDWVNSENIKPNIVITDFIDQSCIKDIISKNFKLK